MSIFDFLYPQYCFMCGDVTNDKGKKFYMCEKCHDSQKKEEIEFIKSKHPNFENIDLLFCVYNYNGNFRDAMIKYKFEGEIWLSKPFAKLLINYIEKNNGFDNIDILTYVPVSHKRFSQRGYDQTFEIAKIISKEKNIPLVDCFIKNNNYGDNAAEGKNRIQRVSERKYSFKSKADVFNKNILLLDDILTTGATLDECSKILAERGADKIFGAVLASGRKDI